MEMMECVMMMNMRCVWKWQLNEMMVMASLELHFHISFLFRVVM
jgi:hypothetical protein